MIKNGQFIEGAVDKANYKGRPMLLSNNPESSYSRLARLSFTAASWYLQL